MKSLTRVGDDDVEPGDEFDPSENELRAFSGKIEEFEADESSGEDSETYTEEELEALEWSDLRQLAVDYEGDEVNGKSGKEEIVSFFAGRSK